MPTLHERLHSLRQISVLGILAMTNIAAAQTAPDPNLGVRLFAANYTVEFRGIRAGDIDFILRRVPSTDSNAAATQYVYESLAHARGLAKLVIHHTVREASEFVVEQGHLKPVRYSLDDGSKSTEDDTDLAFDWSANKAHGMHEDKPIELPLSPGLQDRMSAQVAVMQYLAAGKQPDKLAFIDRDEIKEYTYKKLREERLKTKIGDLDTVVYASSRPESDRVTRLWYAPSLGFIPVRGEQERKGKVETTFEIQKLN